MASDLERPPRAIVVTVSDRAFAGEMQDTSGPAVADMLRTEGFEVDDLELVPDNRDRIIDVILGAVAIGVQLVVTTGGTGLGPRDMTPQATAAVVDYEVPGIAEEMRRASAWKVPTAILSRAVAGVRERTLVINLPGSQRGAVESLQAVIPTLGHAIRLLSGDTDH